MARTSGEKRAPLVGDIIGGARLTGGRAALSTYNTYVVGCRGDQAARIAFGGDGVADKVYNFWIWQRRVGARDEVLALHGYGTFTLGASAGMAAAQQGGTAKDSPQTGELMADTITYTQASASSGSKGPGASQEAAFGSPGVQLYSPADDTEAVLTIPDLLNAEGLVIEIAHPSGTTYGFAMVETMSSSS